MERETQAGRYVALVTDDATFRHVVSTSLASEGIAVTACATAHTARELITAAPPVAIVLEASLGGDICGIGFVKALRRNRATAGIPIVVCSADGRFLDLHLLELIHLGCDVLGIPYNFSLLRTTLDQAIRRGPVLAPRISRVHQAAISVI